MKKFLIGLLVGLTVVPTLGFAASTIDAKLVNRLKGAILLQTQSHGEAWYLNPKDGKRYYMKDGATAFEIMRKFGVGITNSDLEKIPVGTLPSVAVNNNVPSEQPQNNQNTSGYIRKSIGEYVQMATLKYKINTVSEVQSITGLFGTKTARAGTKFVVVNLDVTNTTNVGYYLYAGGFVLLDNQSRQYTTYSDTIGYSENSLNSRALSPSISENGILVYEIPLDSITYDMATTHADTDETYLVKLK